MLDAIGEPIDAEPWLRAAVERGDRLMGFGHRVYKTDRPARVMLGRSPSRSAASSWSSPRTSRRPRERLLRELKPDRPLYANVEFYAGIVIDAVGLPRELFTPTFAVEPHDRLVRAHPRAARRTTASSVQARVTSVRSRCRSHGLTVSGITPSKR